MYFVPRDANNSCVNPCAPTVMPQVFTASFSSLQRRQSIPILKSKRETFLHPKYLRLGT